MRLLFKSMVTVVASLGSSILCAQTPSSNPLHDINVAKLTHVANKEGLTTKALRAGLNAYAWGRAHNKFGVNKDTLTVIDFTLPSYRKRMFVLDLKADKVLMDLYTSQGIYSGVVYAKRFSNRRGSYESSLGLQVTSGEYYGKHGKSMRLTGLEKGINDNVRARAVVIHAAFYATPAYVKQHHYTGVSWGCYAVAPSEKTQLLNDMQGGSALFVYASPENDDPIIKHGPLSVS